MPEKNNFILRLKARNALRGHWQTALLMMMLGSLVSWAAQAVSTIQGNTVLQQLMLAMQQVSDTDFITPDFWTDILSKQFGMSRLLANLLSLLAVLVAPMFTLGYIQYFLNLLRGGEEQRWTAVFSRASSWLKGLGLELWMFMKTMAWALPGLAGLFAVMLISVNVQSLSGYGASWLVTLSIVCYVGAIVPSVMAFFRYALLFYREGDFLAARDALTAKTVLRDAPNLIILKAFTKLYAMAGVRLGYALCSDAALLDKMRAAGQPWAVSGLAQAAGLAALEETAYADSVRTLIADQRPRLAAGLRALGLRVVDGQANYLLFRAPADFGAKLRRHGAVVRGCGNYPGLDETWYRTAVRAQKENEQLLKIMREVLA